MARQKNTAGGKLGTSRFNSIINTRKNTRNRRLRNQIKDEKENDDVAVETTMKLGKGKGKGKLKAKPKDLNVWYNGTEKDKKRNAYCRRRNKLLRLIDEKRLEKYIISMKVDYDEINRSFIESGEAKDVKKQNQKLAGPSRIVRDSAPRFALGFAFVVFINSFIYTAQVDDVAFWFQVFFSLVILLYMFIMGRSYADDYMKKVLIVDLQTRFNIIRDYLSDKVKEVKTQ